MERLAFERDRADSAEDGSRVLRNVILVNTLIFAAAIAFGVASLATAPGNAARGDAAHGAAQDVDGRASRRY